MGPSRRSPARGTARGRKSVPYLGIPRDCCKFWGRCPIWAKIGWNLDRAIRNTSGVTYTRDRQRAHAARCNTKIRRQQLGSSGSHMLQTEPVAENTGLRLDRMWGIDQSRLPPRAALPELGPSAPRRHAESNPRNSAAYIQWLPSGR